MDGFDWQRRTSPFSASCTLFDVRYGDGVWVVVGNEGIATSTDTVNWTIRQSFSVSSSSNLVLAYTGGVWLATKGYAQFTSPNSGHWRSTDGGSTWTPMTLPYFGGSVVGRNGIFMAASSYDTGVPYGTSGKNYTQDRVMYSTDGAVTWTQYDPYPSFTAGDPTAQLGSVSVALDTFIAVTDRVSGAPTAFWEYVALTQDAASWTTSDTVSYYGADPDYPGAPIVTYSSVYSSDSLAVGWSAVSYQKAVSYDAATWTIGGYVGANYNGLFYAPYDMAACGGDVWIAWGEDNEWSDYPLIYYSLDNTETWTAEAFDTTSGYWYINRVAGGPNSYVLIGDDNRIYSVGAPEYFPFHITTDAVGTWHTIGKPWGRLKLYAPGGWYVEKRKGDAPGRDPHTLRVWDGKFWRAACQMQLPPN